MAIDFPASPTTNQTYSEGDRTWKWNGSGWQLVPSNVYKGVVTAVSALNIDCGAGNYFTKTISANSTFTVSNVPSGGAYAFTLELQLTSGNVTWFSGVAWPDGVAPVLATGKTHLLTFVTDDSGGRWRGSYLANYVN